MNFPPNSEVTVELSISFIPLELTHKCFAKRPQVQERLTMQIVQALQEALGTDDVACVIDAKHLCVNSRGIKDIESSTVTSEFGGKFKEKETKREFLDYLKMKTSFD